MCVVITLFVFGLLGYVSWKYRAKNNPEPSKTTHNSLLEVVWTAVPVAILVVISAFSFPYLYKIDKEPDLQGIAAGEIASTEQERAAAELGWVNVKAVGNQWNWTYFYPDYSDADGEQVNFVSNGIHRGLSTDTTDGQRLLSVDYPMVVPAGRYVRYYTGASDVIHSFAMPSFGIKTDAIPGRLNEGWFKVDKVGVYYGQCSELCGKDHAYMPIEIRVVPQEQFDQWMELMQAFEYDAAKALVETINGTEVRVAQTSTDQ